MRERRYFSGSSLEQAVMAAARHYELDPEEVAYRKVEKKHGFLKVRRSVVIEVDPENVRKERAGPAPAPEKPERPERAEERRATRDRGERRGEESGTDRRRRRESGPGRRERDRKREEGRSREERAPHRRGSREEESDEFVKLRGQPRPMAERYPPATGATAEAAQQALEKLFQLGGLELSAQVFQGEDRLEVELSGPDEGLLLEDEGALLLHIQHLLPRLLHTMTGEPSPCRVDCDSFQEVREEKLRDLAQRVAEEVRRLERPKSLRSMNPTDRRIVHLALADDPGVETESAGEGYYKRITVRPT